VETDDGYSQFNFPVETREHSPRVFGVKWRGRANWDKPLRYWGNSDHTTAFEPRGQRVDRRLTANRGLPGETLDIRGGVGLIDEATQ